MSIASSVRKELAQKFSQFLYDALPDPRPEKNPNVKHVPPLFVMCGVDSRDGKPFYFSKFRCGRSVYPEVTKEPKRPWLFEMTPVILM